MVMRSWREVCALVIYVAIYVGLASLVGGVVGAADGNNAFPSRFALSFPRCCCKALWPDTSECRPQRLDEGKS